MTPGTVAALPLGALGKNVTITKAPGTAHESTIRGPLNAIAADTDRQTFPFGLVAVSVHMTVTVGNVRAVVRGDDLAEINTPEDPQ